MSKCLICKEYIFWEHHRCKPCWKAILAECVGWEPTMEDIEDGDRVYARDAKEAAIKFAERYQADTSWYPREMEVLVMLDDTKVIKFTVIQEAVPSYWIDDEGTDVVLDNEAG